MTTPIKILHLEDNLVDAELIQNLLIQKGIENERLLVDNECDFLAALTGFSPDIILANHSSAGFTSTQALKLCKEHAVMVPFILVTENVSEEYAAQIVKDGAYDYILKSHLQKLPSAITHALESFTLKIERQKHVDEIIASEANLRAVFENTPVAFVLMDRMLTILSFNDIANKYLIKDTGMPLYSGRNIIDYPPEGRKADTKALFLDVLEGRPVNYERSYINKDGSHVWYQTHVDPVINHYRQAIGLIMTIVETTDRKKAELEREEITAELVHRNKDLEQFAYIVSHNLRSPVANIVGSCTLMQDPGIDTGDKDILLHRLDGAIHKLDMVIGDLNQILQTKTPLHEAKESVIFSTLVSEIQSEISAVSDGEAPHIITDFSQVDEMLTLKSYMRSIFHNLITNSIKYKRRDVPLVIRITASKSTKDLQLVFKDNGLGIDTVKNRAQLFGLYKRFHLDIEGKGMGLFMVKTQVETLGGTIQLISEENKGCEFILDFKL